MVGISCGEAKERGIMTRLFTILLAVFCLSSGVLSASLRSAGYSSFESLIDWGRIRYDLFDGLKEDMLLP